MTNRGTEFFRDLIRDHRTSALLLVQLAVAAASYVASFVLRLDLDLAQVPFDLVLRTLPVLVVARLVGMALFRLDRGVWRYVSVVDLIQITKATTVSSVLFTLALLLIFGFEGFPRSVVFFDWAGNIFLLCGIRLMVRAAHQRVGLAGNGGHGVRRLLIVGAGDSGASLCSQALGVPGFRFRPVAFVDDDPAKLGTSIVGVPVVGRTRDLPEIVLDYRVETIVIAITHGTPSQMRTIVEACQKTGLPFKILPPTSDILEGTVSISRIRDVDPGDLLGRPQARLDVDAIRAFATGKRFMITGGAGSVGFELARRIASLNPEQLVLIDHAENQLFFREAEARQSFPDVPLVAQVGDVTDEIEMRRLLATFRPNVVFHAAAHKHVPLMERTPAEAVRNNVGGTYVMAKAAADAQVETFILVSTDKAVNPTSVMGATKRIAELIVRQIGARSATQFVTVRFGNVLGSNASLVPILKEQILHGGPVTVTHPDVERYFMSLPEAANLILQAAAVGAGGETYVLDMGEPVKIVMLAELLISLSGLKLHEDIDITYTGLRPGEKLTEELRFDSEELIPTPHEKLLVLKEPVPPQDVLSRLEGLLGQVSELEPDQVIARLKDVLPEYQPLGDLLGGPVVETRPA